MLTILFLILASLNSQADETNSILRLQVDLPRLEENAVDYSKIRVVKPERAPSSLSTLPVSACISPAGYTYGPKTQNYDACVQDYERLYIPSGFKPKLVFDEHEDLKNPIYWGQVLFGK